MGEFPSIFSHEFALLQLLFFMNCEFHISKEQGIISLQSNNGETYGRVSKE